MTSSETPQGAPDTSGDAPVERQPHVPRPPTPEELDEISRDQALITDEWGDAGPPAASPDERSS
jgi:hypothetical protein